MNSSIVKAQVDMYVYMDLCTHLITHTNRYQTVTYYIHTTHTTKAKPIAYEWKNSKANGKSLIPKPNNTTYNYYIEWVSGWSGWVYAKAMYEGVWKSHVCMCERERERLRTNIVVEETNQQTRDKQVMQMDKWSIVGV